jgi:hypothetical protein
MKSFSICGTAFDDGHADSFQQLLHLHISFSVCFGVSFAGIASVSFY